MMQGVQHGCRQMKASLSKSRHRMWAALIPIQLWPAGLGLLGFKAQFTLQLPDKREELPGLWPALRLLIETT